MAHYDDVLAPFDLKTALVLITGGSSGIGLGLVDSFIKRGSRILISGRREDELKKVQAKYGKDAVLKYYVGSVGLEKDRIELFKQATADYPALNVLINNAGIQRRGDQRKEITEPWAVRQEEIDINLSGPIHLTSLFIPHMIRQTRPSAIINVTSGLAFIPFPAGPVYSATKAALHSWTLAMRPCFADTPCRLVEMVPPAVKSNLGGSHDFGEECDQFCEFVVERFQEGKLEFGFKWSEERRLNTSRDQVKAVQQHLLKSTPVASFGKQ